MSDHRHIGICIYSYDDEDHVEEHMAGERLKSEIKTYKVGEFGTIYDGFNPKAWKVAEIDDFPDAYIFGNKGAVWSNEAHLAGLGEDTSTTLCGTPMLSSNHVRLQGIKEVGCIHCVDKYLELKGKLKWQE